jgi:serine/threonine protein kinase
MRKKEARLWSFEVIFNYFYCEELLINNKLLLLFTILKMLFSDSTQASFPSKLGNKYLIKEKLKSGVFGSVYKALNVENDEELAVKFEKESNRNGTISSVKREYKVLKKI